MKKNKRYYASYLDENGERQFSTYIDEKGQTKRYPLSLDNILPGETIDFELDLLPSHDNLGENSILFAIGLGGLSADEFYDPEDPLTPYSLLGIYNAKTFNYVENFGWNLNNATQWFATYGFDVVI